jgi:hypothetical protein
MTRSAFTLLAMAFSTVPAYGCVPEFSGAGTRMLEAGRYTLAYRASPSEIPLGRHFSLEIAVCANAGEPLPDGLSVDAQMPEHRHGMNYKPSIVREAAGRYRADGLMLHMPGRWDFIFEVRAAGRADRVTHSEVIE